MIARGYVPLWCKTNYSFLEGASHPEELVDRAKSLGLETLTITDRDGVYGIVRAFDKARKLDVKLIVGSQVTIDDGQSILLLAQTREGYAQLCQLISRGHLCHEKGNPSVSWNEVADHASGLIALWHRDDAECDANNVLEILTSAFSDRLYALVSRHRWMHDIGVERETRLDAERWNIPLVASTEVLYHDTQKRSLQDALTCIRLGLRPVEAGIRLKPNAEHNLKSVDEFRTLFADEPTWIDRTFEIAKRCSFSMSELEYRYPDEKVPEGYTTVSWLRKLTYDGAEKRYANGIPEEVRSQLEKELGLIERLRYSGYFLTMWEVVQYCKRKEILCQGRGSAANSAVCFCLGVTAIDPVKMNLLFERFLSEERAEPPDIDLDIEHRRREEVIQHVYEKYGRDRAAMVANVVRYRKRSAMRDIGKVLGISEVTLDRCSKLLSHHDGGLEGAFKDAGLDLSVAVNKRLLDLSEELRGFPRHLSIHPGGFLLGSEAIARIVPIENATMPGRTVIQWDKTDIETLNLFKVDLLGLGALTHLDYAFRMLKEHRGLDLSMAQIPSDPTTSTVKKVYDMISNADTVGVFQIESRAQMAMLPKLRPQNYYDLVIEISLVRPGPITGGMVHPYLRRRAKLEEIDYPHPSLIPVLSKTLGIPLFQEQVMKLAIVAADYTPGEADQLRRDMAAWKQTGQIDQHREKLVGRMVKNDIAPEFAERVFNQIKGFGEYGFPESHAASFALIAYATAYFKCHHPDIFSCALLNAWPMGFYSPSTIIEDTKRHGVPVLPIDVLHSQWDCTLESVDNSRYLGVRIGLRYIKGLSRSEADRILSSTKRGFGSTLPDFKGRCRLSIDTWEALAVSGALEGFGVHRRKTLWQVLDHAPRQALAVDIEFTPMLEEQSVAESIVWDYQSMGHSTRGHVLEEYRNDLRKAGYFDAVTMSHLNDKFHVRYTGLVICRQRPATASGVLFMTLEDETGIVNVIVWDKIWQKYRKVILTNQFLAVEGPLQSEDGIVHLIATHFWVPEQITALLPDMSHDFH